MPFQRILTATTTAAALALVAAPVAIVAPTGVVAQAAQDYSAEVLDIFTETLLDVADVRNKYTPVLQAAETEDQQQAIIDQANAEIRAVIENADGITVDQYLEIAQAASQDEALNARIVQRVQDMDQARQ